MREAALTAFMDALESGGAAAALAVYRASPRRELIAKPVERVINSYGYRVLREKRIKPSRSSV